MENDVSHVAHAEFHTIIALQFLPLHLLAIYKSAVLTALVNNVELTVVREDERVIARDPRISNHQILIHFSADSERRVVKGNRALIISLHVDQRGKHS